jgi:Domain of unknown function (DUF1848).
MIISASRRTDIPAYYSEWMVNRLRTGYAEVRNPMNWNQISKVDLSPEAVDCIVFWTKDPKNMLPRLREIDDLGYEFYFQFTLTPYGKDIETGLRDKADIIGTFKELSSMIGPERIVWRYDPVVLNASIDENWHIEKFKRLCSSLEGQTDECMISFVDMYPKLRKVERNGIIRRIETNEKTRIFNAFKDVAEEHGIKISTCCEPDMDNGKCIDPERIERIIGRSLSIKGKANQRELCNCAKSTDIGAYDSCASGCVYCYANRNPSTSVANLQRHDPTKSMLR